MVSRNVKRIESRRKERKEAVRTETDVDVVAIGASTGGPPAIQLLLSEMPGDFPVGIVVSQHMPRGFTKPLADRLNRYTKLHVKEAENDDPVEPGRVLICPGGSHMSFRRNGNEACAVISESKDSDKYIPSVDVMMSAAVETFDKKIMGVVLTGMGNDGTKGMVEIRK
ncbi:MAG: chemotaxis protein CheB, partial [Desulfobacterales bacterium]|nr:chemotaxis protein CheB [Desulfobacterales bacterium]